jgi:hypothetical protein
MQREFEEAAGFAQSKSPDYGQGIRYISQDPEHGIRRFPLTNA